MDFTRGSLLFRGLALNNIARYLRLLDNGTVTSLQLVQEYRRRIKRDNRSGFWLNPVLEVAPEDNIFRIAIERDQERLRKKKRGPLHGVPFIVKDNMVTDQKLGMRTTYGASALQYSVSLNNSSIIEKAQEAGAIVLGKANLAELGGYKGFTPMGWSKVGGTTISPYDRQDPCGSSSGPAVAVAAGFSPLALGTDTTGSITCPAIFNGLYALRPSRGLLSRTGILPTTASFDTAGILAKSAWDIAVWMNVLAQSDSNDRITREASSRRPPDYLKGLDGRWRKWRIGILDRGEFWNASNLRPDSIDIPEEEEKMAACLSAIRKSEDFGVTLVDSVSMPATKYRLEKFYPLLERLILHELKAGLDSYFNNLTNTSIHSVRDLVQYNLARPQLGFSKARSHQEWLDKALHSNLSDTEYRTALDEAHYYASEIGIDYVLEKYSLDAVVVPGWTSLIPFASASGTPYGSVPLGQYRSGKPFGLGFVTRRFDDELLLQIMDAFEASFPPRPIPSIFRYESMGERFLYHIRRTYFTLQRWLWT